jgi:adenylyltransferase/sulfurtransferase
VKGDLDFERLSQSIGNSGGVQYNEFLLRCSAPPLELTLFKDGRAIVKGTEDGGLARSLYSKIVGA